MPTSAHRYLPTAAQRTAQAGRLPRLVGPLDILIIAALAACTVAGFAAIGSTAPTEVVVYRDNAVVARYPLTAETRFTIDGAEGPVVVRIGGGAVRIEESSCRKHVCVATGAIRRPGQQIICVPNRVIVEIAVPSSREGAVDAVAR